MIMRSMLSAVSTCKPGNCCISPSLRIIGGELIDMCKSEPLLSTSCFNKRSISAVGPPLTAGMLGRLAAEKLPLGLGSGMAGARSSSASMMLADGADIPKPTFGSAAGARAAGLPMLSHISSWKKADS